MMSNCAFWSTSGELLAVHGIDSYPAQDDPRLSFPHWAAERRLPAGRLVSLSPSFPALPVLGLGWQACPAAPTSKKGKPPRPCDSSAPVAAFAPAYDHVAARLLPTRYQHAQFTLKAWPSWVLTARPQREEGPEGWYAALDVNTKSHRFLLRFIPTRGRLPGEGWRNMLAWSLKAHSGVRLVPLNALPRPEVLAQVPAWEYRVEAGRGLEMAAWDVQILPTRQCLLPWAPGTADSWEATALLRWVRPENPSAEAPRPETLAPPPEGEPRWADLLARWSASDARLVVQNVLTTQPGGAVTSAALFFEAITLPPGPDGRILVRHVPQDGLPLALLSTLFGRRAWSEIERARRLLPPPEEIRQRRSDSLADLDLRLTEGRLLWSDAAQELWNFWYREPRQRSQDARLREYRLSDRWSRVLAGDPRVPEILLRSLDVTDAALCLRDAPDARWRRFVTARREGELKEELEFCRVWEARGDLTAERQIEAWRCWDELSSSLPLTDGTRGN